MSIHTENFLSFYHRSRSSGGRTSGGSGVYIEDTSFPNNPSELRKIIATRISRDLIDTINLVDSERAFEIASSATDRESLIKLMASNLLESSELSISEKSKLLGIKAQNRMLEFRGGVMEASDVAAILCVERQTVNDKRKRNELMAVNINGRYKYPAWQFVERKILGGLKKVLKELSNNDEWMILRFFIGDNDYLKANNPEHACVIDALKVNKVDEVLNAAKAYFKGMSV
ncbi:MAG: hypothetical protein L3J83_00050 [Proteobacteria bacterium]|nr:hypothetical protein [Pseudomonadota bacterium]